MLYALIENGAVAKYPFNGVDLRLSRKDVSWPKGQISDEMLASWNVLPVFDTPIPAHDSITQSVDEMPPVYVEANQRWERSFAVRAKTAEELSEQSSSQAAAVRDERNRRLAECDWTQVADAPSASQYAWAEYRQKLRDLPAQAGFPWTVVWPDKP